MKYVYDGKHLSLDDRKAIAECLKKGMPLNQIAALLSKDPRTISKEISKHISLRVNDKCVFTGDDKLSLPPCPRSRRFPFVCDCCDLKRTCQLNFRHYDPDSANDEYRKVLVESRVGIDMTRSEFELLDKAVRDGISHGQSLYSIATSDPRVNVTPRELYYMVHKNILKTKLTDLRRAVKYKPRKKSYEYDASKRSPEVMKGRMITDYYTFLSCHLQAFPVQMDTVLSSRNEGDKAILTIHFPAFHLMLPLLIESKTSEEVLRKIDWIYLSLGAECFKRIFPCLLTDRGNEFYAAEKIEGDPITGEQRTNVFYCDSYQSNQKGAIESNHRLLRYILPKGFSFRKLTDDDLKTIGSNIASFPRKELGGKTPIDIFESYYGRGILDKLGIKKIDPDKVDLSPSSLLLKSKKK